jgi:hypothetical protein
MFYKKSNLLFLIIFLLFSCKEKPVLPILSHNELIPKIRHENPYICKLKKRAIFFIEDRFNKVKFKGYILKNCDDSFVLNILGPFNQLAYKVIYKSGSFDILKSNQSVKEKLSLMINDNQVAKLSSLLNIPMILPDDDFKIIKVNEKFYYLKKNDIKVSVNRENLKINAISKKSLKLTYIYDNDEIKELHFLDFSVDIRIKFF